MRINTAEAMGLDTLTFSLQNNFFFILSINVGFVFGKIAKMLNVTNLLKNLTKIDEHCESYRKKKNNVEISNRWHTYRQR